MAPPYAMQTASAAEKAASTAAFLASSPLIIQSQTRARDRLVESCPALLPSRCTQESMSQAHLGPILFAFAFLRPPSRRETSPGPRSMYVQRVDPRDSCCKTHPNPACRKGHHIGGIRIERSLKWPKHGSASSLVSRNGFNSSFKSSFPSLHKLES